MSLYTIAVNNKNTFENLLKTNSDVIFVNNDSNADIQGYFEDSNVLKNLITRIQSKYLFVIKLNANIELKNNCIDRFIQIAEKSDAAMWYSNFIETDENSEKKIVLCDYQYGSVRDNFNFGSIFLYRTEDLKPIVDELPDYNYSALYHINLLLGSRNKIRRIPEFLYFRCTEDSRRSGEKQFDYVNPANRDVQIEYEKCFTQYLKNINAYLPFKRKNINFDDNFEYEASVIIPVKNRVNTIEEAITSVMSQTSNFAFNCIVVDNHSTDGTTEKIQELKKNYKNLFHIIPDEKYLGIGGCWNIGLLSDYCGKFAVQLDSDDIYSDSNTLTKIVDKFYEKKCAMVIGSYKLTDFSYNLLPPGIIDHKEWTDENGHNNALRINGLGAPRCYYTPVIRSIKFPDVSYGEDYAAVLAVTREYNIGRIYEPIYICRRWEGNSDSNIDINRVNENDYYKDFIRTIEIKERIKINSQR